MRRAVARWDALELEEAIIAANGAGGMVRSMEEWARHPQSAAVASLPLLEIEKIGDSPPEALPDGSRPLSGIRVLDLTRVLAGPTCARTLAEHGADVMKITAPHLPSIPAQEYDTGHGKLSAHLDLRQEGDLETMRELVREADIFSQGYRPGTLAKRGLSPEDLAALRPGIIYISLSAFGRLGPWSSRRGFDTVVQTVSGITARQGELFPGAEPGPQFYPVSAIDYLTGYLMAFGSMVALARRVREGGSWLVRISLAQTGRWLLDRGTGARIRTSGCAAGLHPRRDTTLVNGQRRTRRAIGASRSCVAALGDAALLGAPFRASRLPRSGLAGALTPLPRPMDQGCLSRWRLTRGPDSHGNRVRAENDWRLITENTETRKRLPYGSSFIQDILNPSIRDSISSMSPGVRRQSAALAL